MKAILPPPLSPALTRRVKRHVTGRTHTFFVATAPGFERLCRDELKGLGVSPPALELSHGGVTFSGRLADCYLANLHLRTANRVLIRIAEFKATAFRQLEKKLADFPWELYFFPGFSIDINVSVKKSRLSHTGAIAERIDKSIASRLPGDRTDHPVFSQRLFVRAVSDRFTVSMDTSGEALYKRGIKTHGGRAPLRETGAAAILKLTGYTPERPLLDPMCGSGTFSLEAAMMARNMPPGWCRKFAFMGWPSFGPRQWAHLRRNAEAGLRPVKAPVIFASDKNQAACRALQTCLEQSDLSGPARVACQNFFELSPGAIFDSPDVIGPGVVVFNPPFGRRLGSRRESDALIRAIGDKLKSDFSGWRFALLMPRQSGAKQLPFSVTSRPFQHGGLNLTLLTGVVK